MARKLDLLTLLANQRTEGAGQSNKPSSPRPVPRPKPRSRGGLAAWFKRRPAVAPTAQPAGKRTAQPQTLQISALALGALVVAALGVGFLLGRAVTGRVDPRAGQQRELQAPPLEPSWLAGKRPTYAFEKEDDVLERWYLPVVIYEASQKDAAITMAKFLRDNQLSSARIRHFLLPDPETKLDRACWGAVVYVPSKRDGTRCLDSLCKVPAPEFEPTWAERLGLLQELVRKDKAPVEVER